MKTTTITAPAARTSMTRKEQSDLRTLIRDTARVAKTDARRRSAALRADVEGKLSRRFAEDDAVWEDLTGEFREKLEEVNEFISSRCEARGVPKEFHPRMMSIWLDRGENADKSRRVEIRRAAYARIEALERIAVESIERHSLEVQTRLIAGQLETEDAKAFLASLPSVENLMPALEFGGDYKLLTG